MTKVKIADVIVPEVFNPYVDNLIMEKSALVRSGIIATNPELDALAKGAGTIGVMPHWNDLEGESQLLSDTAPLEVKGLTTGKDMFRKHFRGDAWSANDLAGELAGSDPMAAIGNRVAEYWVRDQQRILIATLKGVFGSDTMAGNQYKVDGAFSTKAFLNAQFKLGDAYGVLTAIAVHSQTYQFMNELDLIEWVPDSTGQLIARYRKFEIIVDDGMPFAGDVFTTYLFGKGALGYAQGNPEVPTETDRDSLQGDDILINRQHFVLHPRGIKWTETDVAALTPSNVEIATADNWSRVFDNKKIRMVEFKHKLG